MFITIATALMFGTAGLPHVIVRFFTVPNVKAARVSVGWALLFIAIMYNNYFFCCFIQGNKSYKKYAKCRI